MADMHQVDLEELARVDGGLIYGSDYFNRFPSPEWEGFPPIRDDLAYL